MTDSIYTRAAATAVCLERRATKVAGLRLYRRDYLLLEGTKFEMVVHTYAPWSTMHREAFRYGDDVDEPDRLIEAIRDRVGKWSAHKRIQLNALIGR
ncbi:MAG: hypothetical protein MEQ74_05075 [Paracoccus sp.]|nr:hypothetical protein [Paracoccus sp. (in: a-proteobacteria)]